MREIKDNRQEAMNVGYFATDWSIDIDFETYKQFLEDWDVKGIYREDRCIGAIFRKGTEIHISILPDFRKKWLTKGLLKQLLSEKEMMTQITPGHEHYVESMLKRVGFVRNGNEFVRGISYGS